MNASILQKKRTDFEQKEAASEVQGGGVAPTAATLHAALLTQASVSASALLQSPITIMDGPVCCSTMLLTCIACQTAVRMCI